MIFLLAPSPTLWLPPWYFRRSPAALSSGLGHAHVGPGLGSVLAASELPVALVMALLVLGESITPIQWAGIFLIGAGIVAGNIKNS